MYAFLDQVHMVCTSSAPLQVCSSVPSVMCRQLVLIRLENVRSKNFWVSIFCSLAPQVGLDTNYPLESPSLMGPILEDLLEPSERHM